MSILRMRAALAALMLCALAAPFARAADTAPATLIEYTGQILDARGGFVFFTTGDGYRLDAQARIVDYDTGGPTTLTPAPRIYARARFDPATGKIVELGLTRKRRPFGDLAQVARFAVATSPKTANPDLSGPATRPGFTGKPVLVEFVVQVPPQTPLTSDVYIATDASNWSPIAIKMDRIDVLHYRAVREINSGNVLRYRYTRGSWQTAERAQNGLEATPRVIDFPNVDVKRRDDVVYHWADENPVNQGIGALAIPTPFNPNPFATAPPRP